MLIRALAVIAAVVAEDAALDLPYAGGGHGVGDRLDTRVHFGGGYLRGRLIGGRPDQGVSPTDQIERPVDHAVARGLVGKELGLELLVAVERDSTAAAVSSLRFDAGRTGCVAACE